MGFASVGNDENIMEGKLDPLQVLGLLTKRLRAKNIKEDMEGLVKSTWTKNLSEGI
jgi:hypothetical protein